MLIALAGLGPPGDLDVAAAAANLGVHPARVRSWLRRSHDERHAAAVVIGVLQARYGACPSPVQEAGAPIDAAVVAADQGVHPSTVRRWLRGPLAPAAAAEVVYRLLASSGPAPVTSNVGSVNVARAGQLLGVSPSTVRRWLRNGALPQAKTDQVLELTAPSVQALTREALDLEHARDCIQRLNLGRGRGGMTAQYASTGWLEPHIVSILQAPGTGLRNVTVRPLGVWCRLCPLFPCRQPRLKVEPKPRRSNDLLSDQPDQPGPVGRPARPSTPSSTSCPATPTSRPPTTAACGSPSRVSHPIGFPPGPIPARGLIVTTPNV